MEKKLRALFDCQRFEKNVHLERLINETESRYAMELSDEDLDMLNAAGEPETAGLKKKADGGNDAG